MSEALRKLLKKGNTPQQAVITPHVGLLTLHFQLYGCEDLKAKRKVFTALKAVWGKEPDLAVTETADQEALDCATWTIAALGNSSRQISERLDQVEKAIAERIDAAILDVQREIL
jgi:uncharacterized protein YlxP (DUF503 family)